jgi:hypothetical protein
MTMLDETNIRTTEVPDSDPDLPVGYAPGSDLLPDERLMIRVALRTFSRSLDKPAAEHPHPEARAHFHDASRAYWLLADKFRGDDADDEPGPPVEYWPAPDCPECGNVETRWLARADADAWSCGDCGLEFEIGDPQ